MIFRPPLRPPSTPEASRRRRPGKRTRAPLALLLVLAGAGHSLPALADDRRTPFALSGFGTLGAVYHASDNVEFRRDVAQPDGARGGQISFLPDSMLGVQATVQANPNVEATLQLLSRNSIDTAFRPQVSWAYLKFKPVENVSLRAGRLGIEMYIQGDSTEIGYANLPIRQPVAIFPRTQDGVDVETTLPLGAGTLRLKGSAGRAVGTLLSGPDPYDTGGSAIWCAMAEYAVDGWTGRISTGRLTLKNETSGALLDALRAALPAAPDGAAILSRISLKDRPIDYTSMALAYDSGPWQSIASYVVTSSPDWPHLQHFYGNAGYRIGKFTPYAAYYVRRSDRYTIPTGIPAGLSAATDALNEGAAQAQGGALVNQTGVALGMRYELTRTTALKLQFDRIRYRDPEAIIDPALALEPFASRPTRTLNLRSLALEFVF
jgi:hypothetical protein